MADRHKAARWYGRKGWPVFPLHSPKDGRCSCNREGCASPAKHPRTQYGLKDATTDPAVIDKWWGMWPEANVAIATGKAAGIFVLDVDADSYGYDTLFELLNAHEPIPPTPRSLTGGGGEHYLFAYPTTPIGNSSGKVGPGVDTRGEGGYIVAPPSVHISGRPYSWDESSRPESTAVAPIPTWLLGILLQRIPEGPQGASAVIGDIWKGARDNTLASLAGTMRRRGMSEAAILAALHEENAARCVPPLSDEDVRRIARSISGYTPGDENPSNITIARRIE